MSKSISIQDVQLPENNVEQMNISLFKPLWQLALCGVNRGLSITAALKELNEILVFCSKPASENASEDVICQSETVTEGHTGIKDLSERWSPNEHLIATQSDQCSQVSFH